MSRCFPSLVASLALLTACGGGGGGGGGQSDTAAAVLEAIQPEPPTGPANGVAPATVAAASIRYHGARDGRRTVIGRSGQSITKTTVSSAPVISSGIFDFFTAPFDLFSSIFGGGGGGGGGSSGPTLADYFPAGDNDQWTFLDDAEILQGAAPVLLFPSAPLAPPSDHFIWGFTLIATEKGLSFADQEVAGGTITAPATRPLLWLTNDLQLGHSRQTAGDLTYTASDGFRLLPVHVERTITLVGNGPHATPYSYFDDVLHFAIVDRVTPGPSYPITNTGDDDSCKFSSLDDFCTVSYDIFLARGFGPVEATASDGTTDRETTIERAMIGGRSLPDTDTDGVVDVDDNCPRISNHGQADLDGDRKGDACDSDDDDDGVLDDGDGSGTAGDHPCTIDTAGCDDALPLDPTEQADFDGDGVGNNADPDDDDDGATDVADNCLFLANPDQANHDGDALGDPCDPDDDNDGVADDGDGDGVVGDHPCTVDTVACDDAFPFDATEQMDADGDGAGNNADPDDDNDGVADDGDGNGIAGDHPCAGDTSLCDDAFPLDPTEQADFDGDGIGNHADPDDDGDGVVDAIDFAPLDTTVSEGPYQVYLWVTDPADWSRHLYAIDPNDGTTTEIPAPDPDRPGELWDLAVHPGLPGHVTPRRVAFLSPGAGFTPTDLQGSHLWAADEDGTRDLTPGLEVPLTGVVWRNDGESLFFTRGEHNPTPQMVIQEIDRLRRTPAVSVVAGPVWQPRFSPDQRLLVYANSTTTGATSGLLLLDRETGAIDNITPDLSVGVDIFYLDRTPEFSADGSRLAIAGTRRPQAIGCYSVTAAVPETVISVLDTGDATTVRRVSASEFSVGESHFQLPQGYPAISPLGRWLLVEVYDGGGAHLVAYNIETGTKATVAATLPDPTTLASHWSKHSGGWSLGDPPAVVLPLTAADGAIQPMRLTTDGAPPTPLVSVGHHSDGPILLSPNGRTVFFVEDDTVWRVESDGSGLAPLTHGELAGLELRLEVAR
jgi:hypothetical protein